MHNSEAPDTTYIFKWLCTGFGGPLIAESFKTPDEAAFIYHRLGGTDTQTDQWTFPWFVYEFDYNPFNYRAAGSNQYHPDNIQTSSIVRFRRLWSQPPGVSCQGSVNGHGVILLQHPNMEIISGQENSKRTTWVDPNVWMPVGFDGSTGQGNEEFNFSFSYRFDLEPGVSVPSYAGDFSCDYWAYTWAQNPPNIPVADASKFLTFRSHRPTIAEDVAQPPVADPPLQGTNMMGNWYVYRVVDQNQMGLPGVWVQERFWLGVPDDALINAKPWTTQRQSFSDNEAISVEEFLDGYFGHPDALRIPIDDVPLTPEIDGHEYWAGTLWSARNFGEYRSHFDQTLNSQVWDGVWLRAFRLRIPSMNWHDTEHAHGTRSPQFPSGEQQ